MISKKKLVRDKVHEIYQHREMHTADDQEYWEELLKKMDEEIGEFKENPTIEELVDIIEVAYSMAEFRGVSIKELEKMRVGLGSKSYKKGFSTAVQKIMWIIQNNISEELEKDQP